MTATQEATEDRFADLPGRATAAAIPGARHVELRGRAHHLAPGVHARVVELTTDLVRTTAGGTR